MKEYKNRILALADDYGSRPHSDPVRAVQARNIEDQIDLMIAEVATQYLPAQSLRPDPCVTRSEFELAISKLTGCRVGDGLLEVSDNRTYRNEHIQFLWRLFNFRGAK